MAQRRSILKSKAPLSIGDLVTVHELVYPARTKWYNIGLQLKLPVDTLDDIKLSGENTGDHLRDILKFWLKRDAPTPTIKALVDALKSSPVGESRLACDVEDKLLSLPNSRSFDKSMHTPLVPSRQYNFLLWMKVICILIFMLIFLVGLTLYSDYIHLLFRRVMYHMNLLHSKSLPFQDHKVFVGRELSKREIIQEIYKQRPPIISLVGPPGFGKSTLAIHIGHAMVADGFLVNYVDMGEVSSKQALAEKILAGDAGIVAIKSVTIDRLYVWARGLNYRTLLILDNCDVILHNTTDLQTVVEKLLESSPRLKILITSRKTVLHTDQFTSYQLGNLSSEASCTLLQRVTYHDGLNSTTCKSIASLTGNVPLALQVVGAILNDANSPDVMTIVHKLERDLIPTLSPEELPVEKHVNASINLSYQYLTTELQNIGRYIANFPGSFDEEAACSILLSITNNSITCREIAKYLEALMKRSLLECDRRRNRYQFHTLIRQFFLAVSKEATGENETNHFLVHFQSFYTTVLQTLTEQFNDNHVQALAKLDMERHNILYLLEYLGHPSRMIDITSDLHALGTIQTSFSNSFLKCRFTSRELLGPVSSYVEHLSQKVNVLLKQPVLSLSHFYYFKGYVLMITHLAELEVELNGTKKAVQVFTAEEHNIVVTMEQEQSAEVSDIIVLFYRKLSHYYWLLEDHNKFKGCHEKMLRLTRKLSAECERGKCLCKDIGRAYYTARDYARSAHFFQLALDLQSEKLSEMVRIDLMAHLYLSYYNTYDTVEAEKVLENLTALLPVVKTRPETEVYQCIFVLKILIEIYQLNSKFEDARYLKDKMIKAVRQVGANPTEDTISTALELAVYFFEEAYDFVEAANLAEYALQSFTHLNNKDQLKWEIAQVQVMVGVAKCMTWNLSDGLGYIVPAVDYMCKNISWIEPSFTDWPFTFFCVLLGHLHPLQHIILQTFLPHEVRIIGTLFDVLLDMNTVGNYLVPKSKVENQALSHSTKVVIATETIDHSLLLSVPLSITSWLLTHLTRVFRSVFLVGIWLSILIINVTYVMEKLFLVSCLAYFLWWCIASIVDYCRVFVRFVLYVVILYSVHMSHPFIIHVLSSAIIPCLFLTMCACLSFLSLIWFEINALLYIMALIILLSFYLLWYCITKVMHYCELFLHLCDSIIILSCLNPFTLLSVLFNIVCTSALLLLGGIACGIFEVNFLHLVLILVMKMILLLYMFYYFCILCCCMVYYSHIMYQ